MDFVESLRDVMIKNNLPYYGEINLDSHKYHTFNSAGICKRKCCRYRIFDNYLGAHLKCWRRDIDFFWFYKDVKSLNYYQKRSLKNNYKNSLRRKEKEEQDAIFEANKEWLSSVEVDQEHSYVIKKRIIPYQANQLEDQILLPVYSANKQIISIQKISPDGFKRFAKGTSVKGGFLFLGNYITENIIFCEGWATGCTLYEATNQLVIVTFSSSNILEVASFIRKQLPNSHFIFCADKDKNQIGEKCAINAAKEVGGIVIIPKFESLDQGSDFNDLAISTSVETVSSQITPFLKG